MRAVMAAQTKTWLWTYSRVVSLLAGILLVISLLNCASHQRASEKRQAVAEHSFKGIVKQTLSGYKDNVYGVAFSPDGASVVGGSSDNSLKLIE
jgi:WD40 repeat protein